MFWFIEAVLCHGVLKSTEATLFPPLNVPASPKKTPPNRSSPGVRVPPPPPRGRLLPPRLVIGPPESAR